MAKKQSTVVISTRVTWSERARLQALAELEQLTPAALIHRLLVPAIQQRLTELVASHGSDR